MLQRADAVVHDARVIGFVILLQVRDDQRPLLHFVLGRGGPRFNGNAILVPGYFRGWIGIGVAAQFQLFPVAFDDAGDRLEFRAPLDVRLIWKRNNYLIKM